MSHPLSINNTYALLLASLIAAPAVSDAYDADHHDQRQHSAHSHGHSTLNIVQEGHNLELMLESPAVNIIGFEHSPTNQEEKQLVDKAMQQLRQGEQLFVFPPDAQCVQAAVKIVSELAEDSTHNDHKESDTHDHDHDEHEHSSHRDQQQGHSDFVIHYQFECSMPSALTSLELQLFKRFPLTEEVDAQIVTDKRQFAAELSAQQPHINF